MGGAEDAYLDEYDRGSNSKETVEFDQDIILGLLAVTVQIDLLNTFDSQVLVSQCHLVGAGCKALGVPNNCIRECCREENDLDGWRNEPEYWSIDNLL